MYDELGRLVRSLISVETDLDAVVISEALWLAALRSSPGETGRGTEVTSATRGEPTAANAGADSVTTSSVGNVFDEPSLSDDGSLDPEPEVDGLPYARGSQVRVRRAQALPNSLALGRSLRPLKKAWPRGRRRRLDLDATVHSFAYTLQLVPEFGPAPERWFDLGLVIDDSPSMALWDDTLAELSRLLQQLGAFRHVQLWHLSFKDYVPVLRDEREAEADVNLLRAPDGRRLILVISDGADRGWHDPEIWKTVRVWAASTPTAIVSPLATRMWRRTGLDLPAVRVGPGPPGSRSTGLHYKVPYLLQPLDDWLPVPVATLSPRMIGQWTRTLMRSDPAGCDALLIPSAGRPEEGSERVVSGADLTDVFTRVAAPAAVRLAIYCAPFTKLTLPLIDLVREQLVPEADITDVAELVAGGLLLSDGDVLRFQKGVRAQLQQLLSESDAWQLYDVLHSRVTSEAEASLTFAVGIVHPDGDLALTGDAHPFAVATKDTLEFLGALPTGVPVIPESGHITQVVKTSSTVPGHSFEVWPFTISQYDWLPSLETGVEGAMLLLATLGGVGRVWNVPPDQRGLGAIGERFEQWINRDGHRNSVLLWQGRGHGGMQDPCLCAYYGGSEEHRVTLSPDLFAEFCAAEGSSREDSGSWTIVVVEASYGAAFVRQTEAHLRARRNPPRKLLLIGIGQGEEVPTRTFHEALSRTLVEAFGFDSEIPLVNLAAELRRRLNSAEVTALGLSAEDVLRRQGSYLAPFVGREQEIAEIMRWVDESDRGALVVTGMPGIGKSRLLGEVANLLHLRPNSSQSSRLIRLATMSPERLITRVAEEVGLDIPPAGGGMEWLITQLSESAVRPLLFIDGLDEAHEPERLVEMVLKPLIRGCSVRIVLATRALSLDDLGGDNVRVLELKTIRDAQAGEPVRSRDIPIEPIWGREIPFRNPHFTGREAELQRLRDSLGATSQAWLGQSLQPLFGMGGVGKTEIAAEYCHRYSADYDLVWWVRAEQEDSICDALIALGRRMGLAEVSDTERDYSVQIVLAALRTGQVYRRWLLVFDNVTDPEMIRGYIPRGTGHVIITSRITQWRREFDSAGVEVEAFKPKDIVEFLRKRIPSLAPTESAEADRAREADAARLSEALGNLPLAAEHAAAYLNETRIPIPEYLELYAQNAHEVFGQPVDIYYPEPVATTWSVSLNAVSDDARALFSLLCFFSPEPISEELIVRPALADRVPEELREVISDLAAFRRAVRELARYSLLKIFGVRNVVQVHRVVQGVTRGSMQREDPDKPEAYRRVAHELLAASDPGSPDKEANDPQYELSKQHLIPSGALDSDNNQVRALIINQVRRMHLRGGYRESLGLGEFALERWGELFGKDDLQTLMLALEVSNCLFQLGETERAGRLIAETEQRLGEAHGRENEAYLRAAALHTRAQRHQGNYAEALAQELELLPRYEDVLSQANLHTLNLIGDIAVDLRCLGRYAEAMAYDERALVERRRMFGETADTTLDSKFAVARNLRKLGRLDESLDMIREVCHLAEAKNSPWHPFRLLCEMELSVAMRWVGLNEDARRIGEDNLERQLRILGRTHRQTLIACTNLINTRRLTLDLAAAAELGEETVKTWEKVTGTRSHPNTQAAAVNLAIVHRLLGNPLGASRIDQDAFDFYTTRLGSEHPNTTTVMTNLASDLAAQSNVRRARELGEAAVEISSRTLGRDHPRTLATASNLVLDRRADGDEEGARELHERTLMGYQAVMPGHPHPVLAEQGGRRDLDIEPMSQ